VITTVEGLSAALKQPVHQLADPGTDTLHPARDGVVGLRFDQQMQMALHA
jgi:hypothetical protein